MGNKNRREPKFPRAMSQAHPWIVLPIIAMHYGRAKGYEAAHTSGTKGAGDDTWGDSDFGGGAVSGWSDEGVTEDKGSAAVEETSW